MSALSAQVTELPESRVRIDAEVPATEVQRRVEQAARSLGRELRVPGFRRGKVPAPVVLRRVGREAVVDEAVRGSLGSWYAEAVDAAGVETIGEPELDLGELPAEGEPLRFSFEVGVRPTAELGEYLGLEVGRREPHADPERVQRELEALREKLGRLETVERPATRGDWVLIDFQGTLDGEPFQGGEGRDELVELGSGRLVPGFEDQLVGAQAGEQRAVQIDFPDDYRAAHLAGRHAEFSVTVSEVKEKRLPELDDDLASEAAGFDTLAELREDIERRLAKADEAAVEAEFREAVVDAAVRNARVDVPADLVAARAQEMWEQTAHTLAHQGISKETYVRLTGKSEEQVVDDAKPEAEAALRREAVLAAVVEAMGIAPTDDEVLAALEAGEAAAAGPQGRREGPPPRKVLERLRSTGRLPAVRRDVALRQAIDRLAEAAKPISVDQARAREQLWTPEASPSAKQAGERLWTPGD